MDKPINLTANANNISQDSASGGSIGQSAQKSLPEDVASAKPETPIKDQLSSAIQETESSYIALAFDVEMSKLLKMQSNSVAKGEPYLIPPKENAQTAEEINQLESEINANPWFQNVGIYVVLFENMQESAKAISFSGLIESGYVIDALESEWEIAGSLKASILEQGRKEALKHALTAVISGVGFSVSTIGYAKSYSSAKSGAETAYKDAKNGLEEKKTNALTNAQNKGLEKNDNGELTLRQNNFSQDRQPRNDRLRQTTPSADQKQAKDEYDAAKNKFDDFEKNEGEWIKKKAQELQKDGIFGGIFGDAYQANMMTQKVTDIAKGSTDAIFATLIAEETAYQESLKAAKQINSHLQQSSTEQRTSATREVSEIQNFIRQILSNLYRASGSLSARKA